MTSAPPRSRRTSIATLLGLLALATGAQAIGPVEASAMINSTLPGQCLPTQGVNDSWETRSGTRCIVLDSGMVVPIDYFEVQGEAPTPPQECTGYGCGLPQEIGGAPGGRPRPDEVKGPRGTGGAAGKKSKLQKAPKKAKPKKPEKLKQWEIDLKCAGLSRRWNRLTDEFNHAGSKEERTRLTSELNKVKEEQAALGGCGAESANPS